MKSRYACEGEKLRLRCESDYVLRVFNAKYGRLEPGSSICPHENITDLNCQAEGVLLKVMAMCTNRRRCIIKADSSFLRDPCPGTYKYLEVIYGCGKSIVSCFCFCFCFCFFSTSCIIFSLIREATFRKVSGKAEVSGEQQ